MDLFFKPIPAETISLIRDLKDLFNSLLVIIFTTATVAGCSGGNVNIDTAGSLPDSNENQVTTRLKFSSPNLAQTINVESTVNSGEQSAELKFCSLKSQPGCNPNSGDSLTLTKSGDRFVGTIDVSA